MSQYFIIDSDRENFSIIFTEVHYDIDFKSTDYLMTEEEAELVVSLCEEKNVDCYEDMLDICKECFDVDPNTLAIAVNDVAERWSPAY